MQYITLLPCIVLNCIVYCIVLYYVSIFKVTSHARASLNLSAKGTPSDYSGHFAGPVVGVVKPFGG